MASSTESSTAPGPNGSSIYERTSNADLEKPQMTVRYPLCNRYDGNWELGKRQGFGTFYYANGSKYIGEWHSDLKHGMGKFVFQSGQVFEGEFKNDKMLGGRTAAEEARLLRPQTPLGSLIGDIDHSDIVAGGSITEKFNLEISRLLCETNIQHELRQIHCVLMRHITQLKKIYHHYSSLGSCPAGVSSEGFGQCSLLTQLQLWRLLMDCRVHHQDLTLHDVDYIIHPDAPPTAVHDPTHTFLMREFLQLLVFLSYHLVSSQQETRVGDLSQKLSTFITTHLLPNACQVGGPLFSQPPTCIVQALKYQQEVWQLYQHIQSTRTDVVRLRDILLLLKERGLVTSEFPAKSIIKEMVKSSQLAVDGEDYNLEVKVVFLEFFEILLLCAQEWYKVEGAQAEPKPSVHTVTSNAEPDNEVSSAGAKVNTSPVRVIVSTTDGESSNKQESTVRLSDNQTLEQQQEGEDREEEGEDGEGCSVAGDERDQLGVQETTEEDIEKLISSVFKEEPSDVNKELSWKEMLQAFFDEHLFAV